MSKLDRMLEGMKDYEPDKKGVDEVMDEAEKERLLKNVMKKIETEKVNIEKEDKIMNRKGRKIRNNMAKAAAVAGIVLVTGSVGVVGATMFHLSDKFSSYFGQEEPKDAHIEDNLRKVDAKAVNKGVTVEVDQVLGDDYGFYALFNVKGVKNPERIIEANFRNYEVNIEGLNEETPLSYNLIKVYDDKDDEFSFMLKVNSQNLTGKEISLTLKDFGEGESFEDKEFNPVVKGNWKLNWKLSYKNNAKEIKVNKGIDIYGGKYNWDSIKISPLSVAVSTTMVKQGIVHASDDPSVDLNDEFYVDFADGTRLNKEYMDDDDIYMDGTDVLMTFHSIKNYDDIVSVTYAGVTIPINPEKQQPKKLYVNDKMKFSLQMSPELYDVVKVSKVKAYKDDYLKASGQSVSFVGEKDGAKMTFFSIERLKGMISPDKIEECNKTYLTYKDGYTYIMEYGEIVSEEQMVFADILNNQVAGIKHFLDI